MSAHASRAALRRTLYLRRRPLAALCAFAAVLAALLALAPAREPTVTAVAARTALPAGTVLEAGHLTAVQVPAPLVPAGAASAEADVAGRALAGPVTAGSILTTASVSSGGRVARPGHVVTSLPLPDESIAALVRPGVRVDVLDATGVVLVADVAVVAPPDTPGGNSLTTSPTGRTALVEVPVEVAGKLVSQGAMSLTVVVR